jgi:hypothetical protein
MRKAIRNSGIGVTMLATFLGVGSSVWPEYIRPHPYAFLIFGMLGVVMLLVPFFTKVAKIEDTITSFAPSGSTTISPVITSSPVQTNHQEVHFHLPPTVAFVAPEEKQEKALKKSLELILTSHGKDSTELFLEVENEGSGITVSANLRVVRASAGVAYKAFSYDGLWVDSLPHSSFRQGVLKRSKRSVFLAPHKPEILRIASVDAPEKPEGLAYMSLEGPSDNLCWDIEKQQQVICLILC